MNRVRLLLVGLGNLGTRFCGILLDKGPLLRGRYGLELRLVGAADSGGAAYHEEGLNLAEVMRLKESGGTVAHYPDAGSPDWPALELVGAAQADVLLEASPVNIRQAAEPGLSCIRTALQRGMHVVTANKGPIILAYRELHDLAAENGVQLRFDGAVAGGLPVLYLARRDLRGARILRIEAVPNLVTGYVMDLVGEGFSWNQALVRASREGVLEADASWDLDGWDAAAKLVILVNAIIEEAALRERPARMEDVARTGILDLDPDALRRAREEGQRYRLLAQAERRGGGDFLLSVGPKLLAPEHPLGRLGSKQMGVVLTTDIYGTIVVTIDEQDPVPSAASMLRDLLDIMV